MRDRLLVGVHLAEEQRLEVAPRLGHEMEILHRAAQLERLHHVAFEVEIGGEIGLRDPAFVQAGDGFDRTLVVERHGEGRGALAETLMRPVRHDDLERGRDIGVLRREPAQQRGPRRLGLFRSGGHIKRVRHKVPQLPTLGSPGTSRSHNLRQIKG